MKAIITKVDCRRVSKHGGFYRRVYFKSFENNKTYLLDVYENNTYSNRFTPFIKEQAIFDNLDIFKGLIISGKSNFKYLGIKNEV